MNTKENGMAGSGGFSISRWEETFEETRIYNHSRRGVSMGAPPSEGCLLVALCLRVYWSLGELRCRSGPSCLSGGSWKIP